MRPWIAGKAGKSQPKSKRAKTQAPSPKVQASDDVEDGSGSDGSSLDTTEEARYGCFAQESSVVNELAVSLTKTEAGRQSRNCNH